MAQEKLHTHYDNLKVARNAPPEVIKAAYRILSQRYHPDRNPGKPDAHRVMALVNESYQVLSEPKSRAAHDDWIAEEESVRDVRAVEEVLAQWKSSAQPDRRGAAPQHPRESADPDVPPSERPAHQPERKQEAAHGYSRFNEEQRPHRRHHYAPEPESRTKWGPPVMGICVLLTLLGLVSTVSPTSREPSAMGPVSKGSTHLASEQLAAPTATPARGQAASQSQAAVLGGSIEPEAQKEPLNKIAIPSPFHFSTSEISLPPASTQDLVNAPNGLPWPVGGGYLAGYYLGAQGGLSSITVNNSKVNAPAHVQLFSLTTGKAERHLLVPAHGRFSLQEIRAGAYEIRFKYLGEELAYVSTRIVLQEADSLSGTQYDDVSMTLYKVRGGNMQTRTLPKGEF